MKNYGFRDYAYNAVTEYSITALFFPRITICLEAYRLVSVDT
jgi:hypothetical protein